jgi:hypothetical protein
MRRPDQIKVNQGSMAVPIGPLLGPASDHEDAPTLS